MKISNFLRLTVFVLSTFLVLTIFTHSVQAQPTVVGTAVCNGNGGIQCTITSCKATGYPLLRLYWRLPGATTWPTNGIKMSPTTDYLYMLPTSLQMIPKTIEIMLITSSTYTANGSSNVITVPPCKITAPKVTLPPSVPKVPHQ